jgi:tetratricopeptide (TPR) repeat protein
MEEVASKFNINVVRELLIYGEPQYEQALRKLVKPYHFINARTSRDAVGDRTELHFVVYALDFAASRQVQDLVRVFSEQTGSYVHKIVYAVAPDELSQEILLLLQELGARHVSFGVSKNDDFRDHVKRICVEKHQIGSLDAYELDLELCYRSLDTDGVRQIIAKLKDLPASNEGVLRLVAMASLYTGETRRAEAALKNLLQLNPQNLWAANTLGKLYLRTNRAALGIETLRKLSRFHELNSDRLLTLGNAATLAGQIDVAEDALKKGETLTGGADGRFQEGLAKLKLARHDVKGALQVLAGRGFSEDVISFLNMKAILAMRSGRFDEGMQYYDHALVGCGDDKPLKARIKFNVGLAYARNNNIQQAHAAFLESQTLGGHFFQRAKGPLAVIDKILKRGSPATAAEMGSIVEGTEWETLY